MRNNTVGFSFALWFLSNLFGTIFSWFVMFLQNKPNMVVDARDFYNLLQSFGGWLALAGLIGLYRSLPALLLHVSLTLAIVKLPLNKWVGWALSTGLTMALCVLTFFIYFFHKKPEEFLVSEEMRLVIPMYLFGIMISAILLRNKFFERPTVSSTEVEKIEQSIS